MVLNSLIILSYLTPANLFLVVEDSVGFSPDSSCSNQKSSGRGKSLIPNLVFVQVGAHPTFLLLWLQLLMCKNCVCTGQITHLDCLWSTNIKFARN